MFTGDALDYVNKIKAMSLSNTELLKLLKCACISSGRTDKRPRVALLHSICELYVAVRKVDTKLP